VVALRVYANSAVHEHHPDAPATVRTPRLSACGATGTVQVAEYDLDFLVTQRVVLTDVQVCTQQPYYPGAYAPMMRWVTIWFHVFRPVG
jgi:hypothetical protein